MIHLCHVEGPGTPNNGDSRPCIRSFSDSSLQTSSNVSRPTYATPLPFHPCMHEGAHALIPRLHLPVAPRCNLRCGYCARSTNEHRADVKAPGISARILSPSQALRKTAEFAKRWGMHGIVGIAGPGDPLANAETLKTLELVRKHFPRIRLCLCTNGLNLPEFARRISEIGVEHVSVTVNGFDRAIVARIQPWALKDGAILRGEDAARALIRSQIEGISQVVSTGVFVKINTVVIPELNGHHLETIARRVKELGACVFNPMPLIPRGAFRHLGAPSGSYMHDVMTKCALLLPVFTKCRQCRADAEGIPGKEMQR
jgi:nitrogen fixation protein NifB